MKFIHLFPDGDTFSTSPVNFTVDRGGNASFICTYLCNNLNISWNGPGVEAGNSKLKMEMNATTSTLMITNVNNSHAGEYFCTAHNIEGGMDVKSDVAILTVNCKYTLKENIVVL